MYIMLLISAPVLTDIKILYLSTINLNKPAIKAAIPKTEAEIISSIVNFNESLTIIMVAHRLSTLSRCKTIYRLENGRIVDELKYEDLQKK